MANLTNTLLTKIQTEIQDNATFAYIKDANVYVIPALSEEYIPDVPFQIPTALIYPNPGSEFKPVSIPEVIDEATYQIGISVIQEYWGADVGVLGDAAHKGTSQIENDIMTVFDRNTFSESVSSATFLGATYSGNIGRFKGLSQVHCRLEYFDMDVR